MTGIERLYEIVRELGGISFCYDLYNRLVDIADQIEREHNISDREEHDAAAWVREHGGLERIKNLLNWVLGHCSTKQQLDFDFWLSGRVMHELGFDEDMADRDEVERRLLARLMPEGMEWPRFEDGEKLTLDNAPIGVEGVEFPLDASGYALCCGVGPKRFRFLERVKRPAVPAVPAADGEPLEVGQTVWHVDTGDEFYVSCFSGGMVNVSDKKGGGLQLLPSQLTHTKPEPPESWERIEEDIAEGFMATDETTRDLREEARDIVRRCRALAERERGE